MQRPTCKTGRRSENVGACRLHCEPPIRWPCDAGRPVCRLGLLGVESAVTNTQLHVSQTAGAAGAVRWPLRSRQAAAAALGRLPPRRRSRRTRTTTTPSSRRCGACRRRSSSSTCWRPRSGRTASRTKPVSGAAPPSTCRTRLRRPSCSSPAERPRAEAELARAEQLGLLGGAVDHSAAAVAARAVAQGDVPPGAAAIKVEAAEPAAAVAAPQLLLPAQGASGGAPLQSGVNPVQPPTYPYQ